MIYLLLIVSVSLVITILNYAGLPYKISKLFIIIINFAFIFIYTLKKAKLRNDKGYIIGIKTGLVFSIILFVLNIILLNGFKAKQFAYYLMILFISVFSGIIGKNKQKK